MTGGPSETGSLSSQPRLRRDWLKGGRNRLEQVWDWAGPLEDQGPGRPSQVACPLGEHPTPTPAAPVPQEDRGGLPGATPPPQGAALAVAGFPLSPAFPH